MSIIIFIGLAKFSKFPSHFRIFL